MCSSTVLTVITERLFDCYVESVTVEYVVCTDSVQCAAELCGQKLQRDRMTVILCVLLYSILSVQVVYSVQLKFIDSNYRTTE
jgi:hypothetical protein